MACYIQGSSGQLPVLSKGHLMIALRYILLVIVVLMSFVSRQPGQAQEDADIISHCIDTSLEPVPLSEVEIPGIIFVSSGEGTQAIREPIDTPYFVSFSDHYRLFGNTGSLSPNGQWLAYPTGSSGRVNWTDRFYRFERTYFVNTYTGERVFSVPDSGSMDFISHSFPMMPEQNGANWLNNILYIVDENTVINVETQRQVPYDGVVPLEELLGGLVSPDSTQVILYLRIVDLETGETIETSDRAQWLEDGTGYYVRSYGTNSTSIYNRDGSLRVAYPYLYVTPSNAGRWVAWNSYLLNVEEEQIYDLCQDVDVQFSPDDRLVAVLERRSAYTQLWIFDLTTWEMTPIEFAFAKDTVLVGWWNLDSG